MGKRKRGRLRAVPGDRPSPLVSLEALVERFVELGRQVPDCAFAHSFIGPSGKRYPASNTIGLLADLHQRGLANPHSLMVRINFMDNIMNPSMQFQNHFPSSPFRNPTYVLYFRDLSRQVRATQGFCSAAAAKGFIDEVLKYMPGVKPKWLAEDHLDLDMITLEASRLEEIMEAKGIQMPYPYPSFAAAIAGRAPERFVAEEHQEERPKRRKARQDDVEAPARRRRTGSNEESSVSAADLAETLGMSPGKVRSILRDKGVAKPYSWTPGEDLDKITALLKGAK